MPNLYCYSRWPHQPKAAAAAAYRSPRTIRCCCCSWTGWTWLAGDGGASRRRRKRKTRDACFLLCRGHRCCWLDGVDVWVCPASGSSRCSCCGVAVSGVYNPRLRCHFRSSFSSPWELCAVAVGAVKRCRCCSNENFSFSCYSMDFMHTGFYFSLRYNLCWYTLSKANGWSNKLDGTSKKKRCFQHLNEANKNYIIRNENFYS